MGGNVNPTTIQKAGKSIAPVQQICKMFEEQTIKKCTNFHDIPEFGKDFEDIFGVTRRTSVCSHLHN